MKTPISTRSVTLIFLILLTFSVDALATTFVGKLTKQALKHCEKSKNGAYGDTKWKHWHWEWGFHWILNEEKLDLKPFENHLVVIKGALVPNFQKPKTTHSFDCPMMQMRSDWREGPNGIRLHRHPPKGAPSESHAIQIKSISGFPPLQEKWDEENVTITFANPLSSSLENVTVTAHYEGCYGKPGVMTETKTISSLAQNEKKSFTLATGKENKNPKSRRRYHYLTRVFVQSLSDKVYVNFSQSLKSLQWRKTACGKGDH